MSICPRCGKPVYFGERKTSLGKDWHPKCLKCDKCRRSLHPGQHSEHAGKPYCNPCYAVLFGPEGFRQGGVGSTRKSYVGPNAEEEEEEGLELELEGEAFTAESESPIIVEPRLTMAEKQEMLTRIREFNMYKGSILEKLSFRYKETNGQIMYEGILRVHWGLRNPITLAPGVAYAKHRNNRESMYEFFNGNEDDMKFIMMVEEETRKRRSFRDVDRRRLKEIAENSYVDDYELSRRGESGDFMNDSSGGVGMLSSTYSGPSYMETNFDDDGSRELGMSSGGEDEGGFGLGGSMNGGIGGMGGSDDDLNTKSLDRVVYRSRSASHVRKRSASFKKISRKKKLEESKQMERHTFTPPYGSCTNLRVSNTASTPDVVAMIRQKYKVQDPPSHFALCVEHDSGAREIIQETEHPLAVRLKLGPNEDIAKIYIIEAADAQIIGISAEVAEWIRFALHELEVFNMKFEEEELKERKKIVAKYQPWKNAIQEQMKALNLSNGGTRSASIETDV